MPPMKDCCSHVRQCWIMCALCCSTAAVKSFTNELVNQTVFLMQTPSTFDVDSSIKLNFTRDDACPYMIDDTFNSSRLENNKDSLPSSSPFSSTNVYLVGYFIGQFPASVLAYRLGSYKLIGLGMLGSSIINLISPTLAKESSHYIVASLFLKGLSESVIGPLTMNLIANWSPVSKRATFTGIVIAGAYIGSLISSLLFQLAIKELNMHAAFYFGGITTLIWSFFWFTFAFDSPLDHPYISEAELSFHQLNFLNSRTPTVCFRSMLLVLWKQIFRSAPFLVLLVIDFAHCWTHQLMLYEVPYPYTKLVFQFSEKLAWLSQAVVVAALPSAVLGGVFTDWLVNRQVLSLTASKRIFVFLGVVVPPFILLHIPIVGCQKYFFMALLVVALFCKGLADSSIQVNTIDLGPRYAGLLMAIMNSIGTASGYLSSQVVKLVIFKKTEDGQKSEWDIVFFISMVAAIVMSIPYMIWCSGEEQPWLPDTQANHGPPTRDNSILHSLH